MQQVKLFKSVDTELPELEKQINRFIRKNNLRVLGIHGNLSSQPSGVGSGGMSSFAAGDVLIILHYEVDKPAG